MQAAAIVPGHTEEGGIMLEALRHGLRNLLNFQGRDARQAFWYYALLVYAAIVAVTMLFAVPMMVQAVMAAVRETVAAGPSQDPAAAQMQVQAAAIRSISGAISSLVAVSTVVNLLMLALLAASFVRRLHDANLSGLWALLPGTMQLVNIIITPGLTRKAMATMDLAMSQTDDPAAAFRAMQSSVQAASLLGWAGILVVVVLGMRKSTPGPNRYGDEPFVV
ncbi:MAG: DUF805 domain-containing protein [Novosphingobium sp.]|jgi:uncharacterized membrane protein YhaH (DUF805 family)|nr:DUF805 domain-containing protein [Novosphingobium sp.]